MVHGLERPVLLRRWMDYVAGVTMEMVGNGIYRDEVFLQMTREVWQRKCCGRRRVLRRLANRGITWIENYPA